MVVSMWITLLGQLADNGALSLEDDSPAVRGAHATLWGVIYKAGA